MLSNLILFHRRLIVLILALMGILGVLVYQTSRLMLDQGAVHFLKAQGRLHATSYLPTWRGQIRDRKGRVIAQDVASYDIAVDWDLITGDRAIRLAREDARDAVGQKRWLAMSPEERQSSINRYILHREEELEFFWATIASTDGIDRMLLNERLIMIRKDVQHTAQVVWARQEEAHKRRYGSSVPFVAQPIKEQREPHVVIPRVSDEMAMHFKMLSDQFDGAIKVQHARRREYVLREQTILIDRSTLPRPMRQFDAIEISLDDIAQLIVGDVREDIWAQDIDRRPFRRDGAVDLGGYRIGDEVGNRGLELSLEDHLRGLRGRVVLHRNGTELARTPPVGGNDVQITLDMKLQARVEAVLSPELGLMQVQPWHRTDILPIGTPLRGAVVVLDVATSEVLAMASTPALRDEQDVEGYPWLNRAAEGLYPPGSIIKPLVLNAAVTEGVLQPDESITCVGHFFEGVKDVARCWIYRAKYNFATHGSLQPVEAIARSCNIFFYELGTRLGFRRLLGWLQAFGMSKPLAALLTDATALGTHGHVPTEEEIESLQKRGALAFETVSVAIGQGALTWSPLHAGAAYATIARNGIWRSPTLLLGQAQVIEDLQLDQRGVQLALDGLHDSVTKRYGTGSRLRYGPGDDEPTFNVDGVRLWGKTGTAEAPPYRLNKETPPVAGLDHSWYVVMAAPSGAPKPTVVVVVLVEHGGSGGRVAGPIANQVLHALVVEGYLEIQP